MTIEIESFLEPVLVFGDAAVRTADGADQRLLTKRMKRFADRGFVERHDGIAIGFLVTRVRECVERKGVVLGSGDFFFNQGAENAALDVGQEKVHELR